MQFTIERTFSQPRDTVYHALTDIEHWTQRVEGITKVEPVEGGEPLAFQEGYTFKESRVMFGKEATETMTIRDVAPNEGYALTAHSCGADHRYTYRLRDTPEGGTHVTLTGDVTPCTLFAKVMGAVMTPIMKGPMLKCMHKDFDSIERSMQAGA